MSITNLDNHLAIVNKEIASIEENICNSATMPLKSLMELQEKQNKLVQLFMWLIQIKQSRLEKAKIVTPKLEIVN